MVDGNNVTPAISRINQAIIVPKNIKSFLIILFLSDELPSIKYIDVLRDGLSPFVTTPYFKVIFSFFSFFLMFPNKNPPLTP